MKKINYLFGIGNKRFFNCLGLLLFFYNEICKPNKGHEMLEHLYQTLRKSSDQTISYLGSKLLPDGSYGADAKDIACYFKSPMMFIMAKKFEQANTILNYIKLNFMQKDGDFKTGENLKSIKPEYQEFWTYTNGWIVRAAEELKFTEISDSGYNYLQKFVVENGKGFLTNSLENHNDISDVLTASHHGLINLERGNLDLAKATGDFLHHALTAQPAIDQSFYLRLNAAQKPLTEFTNEMKVFYCINKNEPNQLYFMIGYPSAYLALLYKKTNDPKYLDDAKAYLDFALSCHESVLKSNFSHKIAWAASILYENTQDLKYLEAIRQIVQYFQETKGDNTLWYLKEEINISYDQSAEIACWFLDIANRLESFVNKKETLQGLIAQAGFHGNNSKEKIADSCHEVEEIPHEAYTSH